MATYPLQGATHAGLQLAPATPANGDLAPTGPNNALLVVNPTGGTSITVAIPLPNVDGTQTVTARTVTIPAGTGAPWLIPLPSSVYGTGLTGALTYTGTLTNVTVYAIRLP